MTTDFLTRRSDIPLIHYCYRQDATAAGAKEFIDAGSDVRAFDSYGRTALHAAVEMGNIQVAEYLILIGADIDARLKYVGAGSPDPAEELPTRWGWRL
jgi:ankyrin repeat protein